MLEVRKPEEKDLADLLYLLLKFREEFADTFPQANIRKVAIEIDNHFKNGFITNAYKDGKLIGSIGAYESPWWFSDETFVAETWFYVLPDHRDFTVAKKLIQKIKNYAKGKTIQIPVSSGKDTAALYKRMGFKKMGNIWRYN
mgnify:FL=1